MSRRKKKFSGVNSKAAEARQRKADAKAKDRARKAKEAEDRLWADDGRVHENVRAHTRRQEAEARRQEKLEREAKKRALERAEAEAIKKHSKSRPKAVKMTRAQIEAAEAKRRKQEAEERQKRENEKRGIVDLQPDVSQPDVQSELAAARAQDEEKFGAENVIEAHSLDEALSALKVEDAPDRFPERRAKALHRKFEEEQLPIVKAEHPGLRLSQYKEIIWKKWLKSPENPHNWPRPEK